MTVTTPEQAIVLAYARLKGMRDNINMNEDLVPGQTLYLDFNKAISDLATAGFDLSEFAITDRDLVANWNEKQVRPDVLRARIDALLIYFSVETGEKPRPRVGFEPPSKS